MTSLSNNPSDFLAEALGGLVAAHPDATWHSSGFVSRRDDAAPGVAVISGGGSGHEPLHAGFIGAGMLDAVAPGHLFTSPNAVQITEATRWADAHKNQHGVLQVVKNYTGDIMNFTVARQTAAAEGIEVRQVIVEDDVATDGDGPGRRGTAATIIVEKIAGAAALRGDDLDEVTRLAQYTADNSRSMAIALAPGQLPTTGRDTFDLPIGQMEVGVGIHGERGVERTEVSSTKEVVEKLLERITASLSLDSGDEVICLVNGLGATTNLELGLVFAEAQQQLSQRGISVVRALVGTFVTSVNMAGVSLTLTRVDAETLSLFDAPTSAPAWPRAIGQETSFVPARQDFDDSLPTSGETNEWLTAFLKRIMGAIDDLTELDRQAGDGDFGANLQAAFGDIDLPVVGEDREVLNALSQQLFIRSGGTSGAVLGTLLRELATASHLADGLHAALTAIQELGGAQEGDNTLVDALAPAARAAEDARDGSPSEVLAAAYDAAEKGARGTRDLVARKGRASYVGDAAKGLVDPGAIAVAWLFGGSGKVSDFT